MWIIIRRDVERQRTARFNRTEFSQWIWRAFRTWSERCGNIDGRSIWKAVLFGVGLQSADSERNGIATGSFFDWFQEDTCTGDAWSPIDVKLKSKYLYSVHLFTIQFGWFLTAGSWRRSLQCGACTGKMYQAERIFSQLGISRWKWSPLGGSSREKWARRSSLSAAMWWMALPWGRAILPELSWPLTVSPKPR